MSLKKQQKWTVRHYKQKKGTSKDMFDRIKGKTCFSMLRVKNEFWCRSVIFKKWYQK